MRKKKVNPTEESNLQNDLHSCVKLKDFLKAISLYDSALSRNLSLSYPHFNFLLYLCSMPDALSSHKSKALEYGFRVFDHMRANNVSLTEATITQVARLAAANGDSDYAFELIKGMKDEGMVPKLRTYDPALYGYCEKFDAEMAYVVEEHMIGNGVVLEEEEIVALLRVSVETGREEKVYEYLQKLRGVVRGVSEAAAAVVEMWFRSERAVEVGEREWDVRWVREERERNGGGWHGVGWLGVGKWEVKRVNVGENGACCGCGEQLVCVDIDVEETERFGESVAALALERETKLNFKNFIEWVEKHSHYEAIVDGANIGLYQQNFDQGQFSISQLEAVVNELFGRSQKWPLVVLHNKRVRGLQSNPYSQKVLNEWTAKGVLYATPHGSNDDWYWLYAAVKLKCLLVTNDEMRDHIFELLGSSFFQQWKERHLVRYTFVRGIPKLQMPPIYSVLLQESERGSWHVPVSSESSDEASRTWLCITRPSSLAASEQTTVTGKRKER